MQKAPEAEQGCGRPAWAGSFSAPSAASPAPLELLGASNEMPPVTHQAHSTCSVPVGPCHHQDCARFHYRWSQGPEHTGVSTLELEPHLEGTKGPARGLSQAGVGC